MIGVEGMDIAGVKKTLDREGVPTPGGARYRSRTFLKRIVLADVYKPHTKKRRPGRQSLSRQISSVVAFRKWLPSG